MTTSGDWCARFEANAAAPDGIPWDAPPSLSESERRTVAASIQEFQVGESSDGTHLRAAASAYASREGDSQYEMAIALFIAEEQRHAAYLARFLRQEGISLGKSTWADIVFRFLRRGASLERTIAVLLTAELIAQVYYAALRDATGSPTLRAICARVLRDEEAHVRFQSERLAMLRSGRRSSAVRVALAAQGALFASATLVVWSKHHPVLRRGGLSFADYRRACWRCFTSAARMMAPPQIRLAATANAGSSARSAARGDPPA
jgi:hypothetical protein